MEKHSTGKSLMLIAAGLAAGAVAGMAIGVLFAPSKGKKTRKRIKKRAQDLSDKVDHLKENVSDFIEHNSPLKHQNIDADPENN